MKKKVLAAALLASMAMTASTAFAAEAVNPFTDIPADHWAYHACQMLQEDGVLLGYTDGTFQGDKLMNRYEMAEVVARAVERYDLAGLADRGAIQRLQNEFAPELKNMNVRLVNVENDVKELKKGMSSFKWFGDARVRYRWNPSGVNRDNVIHYNSTNYAYEYGGTAQKNSTETRLRLGFYGEPADKLSVTGRLKVEDTSIANDTYDSTHEHDKNNEKLQLDRLQLDWHAKNGFTVSAGRNEVSLGQGLLYWENTIDSVMVKKDFGDKVSFTLGAGDAATGGEGTLAERSEIATFADLKAKLSPAVELSVAYLNSHSDATGAINGLGNGWSSLYYVARAPRKEMSLLSYGINAELSNKWTLTAEATHNMKEPGQSCYDNNGASAKYFDGSQKDLGNSNDKNGFWARLAYGKLDTAKAGTWQIYGEYMSFGGLAIDSSKWAHRLNVAGGDGFGGHGVRGWGLGASYMLATNTNLELAYYDLKPYDSNKAGFDGYDKMGLASLSYSF